MIQLKRVYEKPSRNDGQRIHPQWMNIASPLNRSEQLCAALFPRHALHFSPATRCTFPPAFIGIGLKS